MKTLLFIFLLGMSAIACQRVSTPYVESLITIGTFSSDTIIDKLSNNTIIDTIHYD